MVMRRRGRRVMRKRSKLLARRRNRIPRVVRGPPAVHRFKEMVQIPALQTLALGTSSGVLSARISSLYNWSNFKQLFDLYKITGVKWTFIYRANVADPVANSTGAGGLPLLYIATNRDPFVIAPSNSQDIINDDTCKVYRLGGYNKIDWYVKAPKPDMTITIPGQEGGPDTFVPYNFQFGESKKFQPWLTTGGNLQVLSQENVGHFGLRYYIDNLNGGQPQEVQVYQTIYFTMKEQD